jgi:hypothetical protein
MDPFCEKSKMQINLHYYSHPYKNQTNKRQRDKNLSHPYNLVVLPHSGLWGKGQHRCGTRAYRASLNP